MGAKGAKMKVKWGPMVAKVHQHDQQATNMGSQGGSTWRPNGCKVGFQASFWTSSGKKCKTSKCVTPCWPKVVAPEAPRGANIEPKWEQHRRKNLSGVKNTFFSAHIANY